MTKRKWTRIDMHNHTPGSDGHGKPEDFVEAVKASGLHGMVITDHHKTRTKEGVEVCRALQDAGFFAMLGCEYSTKQGHLLIYGVDVAELKLGMYPNMQETIHRVLEAGGVPVPAHPYKGYRYSLKNDIYFLEDLNHVEVLNGQNQVNHTHNDERAKEAQKSLAINGIGGSDAHFTSNIGLCWTEFEGIITKPEELLEALKAGACRARRSKKRLGESRRARVIYLEEKESERQERMKLLPSRAQSLDSQGSFWNRWGLTDDGYNHEDPGAEGLADEDIPWWAFEDGEGEEDSRAQGQSWADEAAEVQEALRKLEEWEANGR